MPKKLMLTVNVITYNHEKWIAQCLESILAQRTKFDFVVRIFEDCSTDKTADICREFKEKYPDKIELHLAEVNLGALKNIWRSHKDIKTPYYLYIEADDYIVNEKRFQMQVDALEKHKECSFSCGKGIDGNDKMIEYYLANLNLKGHTPLLDKTGIYDIDFVVENPQIYIFSFLGTRIVRTKCIYIDEKYPNAYLFDTPQMFELLKKGSMYFFNDLFFISRHTGEGVLSSQSIIEKINWLSNGLYEYNTYSNRQFEKNLCVMLGMLFNWYAFYYDGTPIISPKKSRPNIIQKIQKIKRYFIPRFILDILNIPRNIIRFIRKYFKQNRRKKVGC